MLSCLPVNFVINHLKGHQDELKPYNDLTIVDNLNVDADTIATTCATNPINLHLPSAPFVIYVKGEYNNNITESTASLLKSSPNVINKWMNAIF